MKQEKCEHCYRPLMENEIVWLELSNTDGKYYKEIPKGHKSQGAFPFGKTCAEKVLKETSISKDSLEFEVGKFYTSGATASQYIKSKRGEQSIALMDWYNDNAETELKKEAEFICEAANNHNTLKKINKELIEALDEITEMAKRWSNKGLTPTIFKAEKLLQKTKQL